jgi:hypothetical protein
METKGDFWWSEEKVEELIALYKQGENRSKIAKVLGTTLASINAKAKRLGIRPKSTNAPTFEWTDEMIATLERLYPTTDRRTLVEVLGVPSYVIGRRAQKTGLRNTNRAWLSAKTRSEQCKSCNIHYFDEWTPDMAYILGFMFADGSITKRLCDMIIGVAVKDLAVLKFIQNETKNTRELRHYRPHVDKDGCQHQESVYLTLSSMVLVRRLMELGLKPRKTYNDDPFPAVPDDVMPHFIRGYFDGDGAAFVACDGRCHVRFIGSPRFIKGIRDALVRAANMTPSTVRIARPKVTLCGRVAWTAQADVRKFRDYIYPPGFSFCLERKKTVLDNWLRED